MFCIKCGNNAVVGNFCKKCFLEKESLFRIKNFRITKCDVCGSFYERRKIEIGDAIKKRLITKHKIKGIRISYRKHGNHISAEIECSGIIKPFSKAEKKTVDIIVDTRKCDDCTKLAGNYYEAVLQIRGDNREKILEMIKQSNALCYIRDVDKGYDVRLVKKHDAAKVANILKLYMIKRTAKLVGEKDGKKIYRAYYSIR